MSNTRVDNLEQEKNVLLQVCMPWPLGSSIIQTQRIYSKPKKKKRVSQLNDSVTCSNISFFYAANKEDIPVSTVLLYCILCVCLFLFNYHFFVLFFSKGYNYSNIDAGLVRIVC